MEPECALASPRTSGVGGAISVAGEECYAFAAFLLYPRQRTLLLGAEPVVIGARAFDLLLLLVSRAGTVIGAGELRSIVWPNIRVEEANLRVQMGVVRKTLARCGDAGRAIETVPMRGYCFVLPVRHRAKNWLSADSPIGARETLPVLLNPVIGRDDAIGVVARALDKRRLVTITGPGGIGKTVVAIATARIYASTFAGTIAFVDLSQATDGAQAVIAIADALGFDAQGDAVAALCSHLAERSLLVILDTCEHLVEPVAALAEMLLGRCAGLRLLVTSREALRANGEWTHRLPPLVFPEEEKAIHEANLAAFTAITLFVDRVRASLRFEIRGRDLPVLGEICRRLDGVPLALELAAARVADLGLGAVAAQLDDRFSILVRGRRTALPRHRTLLAALDWSFGLLSDDERRMLRSLTTLGGMFTAEHACIGGDGCERPAEALAGLYEKSLISMDITNDLPIYRLADTTRAYVASFD